MKKRRKRYVCVLLIVFLLLFTSTSFAQQTDTLLPEIVITAEEVPSALNQLLSEYLQVDIRTIRELKEQGFNADYIIAIVTLAQQLKISPLSLLQLKSGDSYFEEAARILKIKEVEKEKSIGEIFKDRYLHLKQIKKEFPKSEEVPLESLIPEMSLQELNLIPKEKFLKIPFSKDTAKLGIWQDLGLKIEYNMEQIIQVIPFIPEGIPDFQTTLPGSDIPDIPNINGGTNK